MAERLIVLEEIAPGIRGRTIPIEESVLQPEQVDKLALQARERGGEHFEKFVRDLYAPELARQKRKALLSSILSVFKR